MMKRKRLKGSGTGLFEEISQQFSGWHEEYQRKSQPVQPIFLAGFYHGTFRKEN
jgi:hypothetical protein